VTQIGTMRAGEEYVDEIVCLMQGSSYKTAIVGFDPLPVRVGMAECRSGSREAY
jgi:hypothetical protein